MKKTASMLAATLIVAGGLTACAKPQTNTVTDPALKKDLQVAEAKVQKCGSKTGFFTKSQRKQFITCIAPKGKQAQVKTCITTAAKNDLIRLRPKKVAFTRDAAQCLVR